MTCQAYAPILEEVYVNWGEGNADLIMLGLSPYDTDADIDAYKAQYGITNPCAGTQGGAYEAIQIVIDGQNFYSYPAYCVICPDKKLYFNICFPPDVSCFNDLIITCGATSTNDIDSAKESIEVYPNPASGVVNIKVGDGLINDLRIFNAMGGLVKSIHTKIPVATLNVSVADLAPGIYVLKIETDQHFISRKITVQY